MKSPFSPRLIDQWFPVTAVDEACRTPAGSGLTEKAIFTWFASRPIAQARAAALTVLLPPDEAYKQTIEAAILRGEDHIMTTLSSAIIEHHGGRRPILLDMFSGRGIIPLEGTRAGANAIGIDLSPVATLAGRLLADYPARNWNNEPRIPFGQFHDARMSASLPGFDGNVGTPRIVHDVERLLEEIGRRVAERMAPYYPKNELGEFPWAYLWAIAMPCDGCKRKFPLVGSLLLRYPNKKTDDDGQSLRLLTRGDSWSVNVIEGPPVQQPTYVAAEKADGKKRKGKSARCLFCGHIHPLEAVKAKGELRQYEDVLLAVADVDATGRRFFRLPTDKERAATKVSLNVQVDWPYPAVPNERIATGNVHTVMASGYGYWSFGELMCDRQTLSFIETIIVVRKVHKEMLAAGLSTVYAGALAAYAAATICRRLRLSTRGARLRLEGAVDGTKNSVVRIGDLFTNQASINFQFDYLETGPGSGPGSWKSVSETAVRSLLKVCTEQRGVPVRLRMASATALPMRDASVDVVITDPPYYDMVEYADASDLFHVWLKRTLFDIEPDLFGLEVQQPDGLQNKNDEIIVRRVHEPGRVRHDREFYEVMLAKAFDEARRVLKPDGHLVVVFGHSDPDAWRRLLGALQTAGFVVTSAWPSRTETGAVGVASIRVTVTIGCRVAPIGRPLGTTAQVDLDVMQVIEARVRQWDADGLALEDQLMASYGPAMEVYGRYSRVLNPDGTVAELDRYLNLARRAVREAMHLKVDELPLETFDAISRFSIFWLRAKGRGDVPKGEALFFAQADQLRLVDLRERVLSESTSGFRLRLDDPGSVHPGVSTFELARAMAAAWNAGGTEAVAATIASAGRQANDPYLWALVGDLATHLPPSDQIARALAGIKRTSSTIGALMVNIPKPSIRERQMSMNELFEKEI